MPSSQDNQVSFFLLVIPTTASRGTINYCLEETVELLFIAQTTKSNQLAATFGYMWGVEERVAATSK